MRAVLSTMRGALANDRAALEHVACTAEDPLVVGNAISALGRTRSPEACDHLRGFLDDARPRVRHEAIRALASCGAEQMSTELASLAQGADETAALLSIQALGAIGDEKARRCLEQIAMSDGGSPARRSFARHELAKARGSLVVSKRAELPLPKRVPR
ncbi:MAG: HEAT repeat domain-containing protein [Planctomycetes bacterium]|nr:HEAT repeat domain-containing protein [Planctomycetota bacterium]